MALRFAAAPVIRDARGSRGNRFHVQRNSNNVDERQRRCSYNNIATHCPLRISNSLGFCHATERMRAEKAHAHTPAPGRPLSSPANELNNKRNGLIRRTVIEK